MRNPVCYKSTLLIGGKVLIFNNRVIQFSGGYTNVFPFVNKNCEKLAVRCWTADIGDVKKRTETISTHLQGLKSPYFVSYSFIEKALLVNGEIHPVSIMEWVEGKTLKVYLNDNISDRGKVLQLAQKFKEMVDHFHLNNIAHGDFQHGNIMVMDDGSLIVIDYDSMYVSALNGMADVIKGRPEYQHPRREDNLIINPHLDYFSELVIYISLLAYEDNPSLWDNDTEWLVFSKEDFESPNTSQIMKTLIKSSNKLLSGLTFKLIQSLQFSSILQLKPLEVLIEEVNLEGIANDIIDKF